MAGMSPFLFAAESPPRQFANFEVPGWVWAAFVAVVVALLLVDLLLVHRNLMSSR